MLGLLSRSLPNNMILRGRPWHRGMNDAGPNSMERKMNGRHNGRSERQVREHAFKPLKSSWSDSIISAAISRGQSEKEAMLGAEAKWAGEGPISILHKSAIKSSAHTTWKNCASVIQWQHWVCLTIYEYARSRSGRNICRIWYFFVRSQWCNTTLEFRPDPFPNRRILWEQRPKLGDSRKRKLKLRKLRARRKMYSVIWKRQSHQDYIY